MGSSYPRNAQNQSANGANLSQQPPLRSRSFDTQSSQSTHLSSPSRTSGFEVTDIDLAIFPKTADAASSTSAKMSSAKTTSLAENGPNKLHNDHPHRIQPPCISELPQTSLAQRFESDEHLEIGDDATQDAHGAKKTVELAPDYRLTYGEMVAMAGDYFTNLDEMKKLANVVGTGAGTREELEYVKTVKIHGKEKLASKFSEGAKKAADERYYALAADNRSHFLNPNKGDTDRSTKDKMGDTISKKTGPWYNQAMKDVPSGALGYYRQYHARAIIEAIQAARGGAGIDQAMAAEAFGGHYLTDMFAAGHLRTPRGSISAHWNSKVPMFFYNFKGFVAENIAKYINDNNWRGYPASVPTIYETALETVTESLEEKGMPELTFGDLVAGAVHDYDNEHGVKVTTGGAEKTLYGDGNLQKGDTKAAAVAAVEAGVADIERAYSEAKAGKEPISIIVKLMGSGLFAPEKLVPIVKPNADLDKSQRSIAWEFDDATALLRNSRFQDALKLFVDEKKKELAAVGDSLDAEYKREAFKNGVLAKLEKEPIQTILNVVHWTPDLGSGYFGDADAKARDYVDAAEKKKVSKDSTAMESLSYTQRHNLMVDLLDGPTVGDDEDTIMKLLKTADKATAKKLIKKFGWERLYDEIDDGPGESFKEAFPESEYSK